MLNISENHIPSDAKFEHYESIKVLRKNRIIKNKKIYIIILIILCITIFLPWTQNISSKGKVTTYLPNQQPQTVQAVIPGRLTKWFIRDGEFVHRGDTLVYITEIKSDYFDPNLIANTQDQVNAKSSSIQSYKNKIAALENQNLSYNENLTLKLEQIDNKILQSKNKIKIDSTDLIAAKNYLDITKNQVHRTKELQTKGLKSLSELQEKELKFQEANAKFQSQENKLRNQKNELQNLKIEKKATFQEYQQKIIKNQYEIQAALADELDATGGTSKLKSKLNSYQERSKYYYITAPVDGYVTKTLKKGIGQIVKEGTELLSLMPSAYNLAVELYVEPQDLPLLRHNDKTILRFDGWPALVISGWPEKSTGIFHGQIYAMDQFISENGMYRVLIKPAFHDKKWPKDLRVGTGTYAAILLKNVPIWYELWRNLNGFPADFYRTDKESDKEKKESDKK